jgi:hypothetical protein
MSRKKFWESPEWGSVSRTKRNRSGWQCAICKRSRNDFPKDDQRPTLNVHHMYYGQLGDEALDHLIVLCRHHHLEVHQQIIAVNKIVEQGKWISVEVFYSEVPEMPDDETGDDLVPLDWASMLQLLIDCNQPLAAESYAYGTPELRGDVLKVTFPAASPPFVALEAQKPPHLQSLKDVVEKFTGVSPRLVLEIRE